MQPPDSKEPQEPALQAGSEPIPGYRLVALLGRGGWCVSGAC
jgi:hypothetical protein